MKFPISSKFALAACAGILSISILLAWSPWITEDYAERAVDASLHEKWDNTCDGPSWNITSASRSFFGASVYVTFTVGFPAYLEPHTENTTYFISCFGTISKIE